jgi:peroxin-11B
MNLDRTISWINKTEGRDKFCKAIQYASRFITWTTLTSNPEVSKRFNGLFVGMRDARKLFRLFKSINEYQKITQLLNKIEEDEFAFYFNILNRLGFLGYWFFDNLNILSKVNFLKLDAKKNAKIGAIFWFFALIFALVLEIRNLIRVSHQQIQLEKDLANCKEEELDVTKNRLKALKLKKKGIVLNIIKSLGDLITASQGSEIAPKLLKINFNDGWVGIGGLVSALITSYQLY